MSAGKGDKPRSCFSKIYKDNYDDIKWGNPHRGSDFRESLVKDDAQKKIKTNKNDRRTNSGKDQARGQQDSV